VLDQHGLRMPVPVYIRVRLYDQRGWSAVLLVFSLVAIAALGETGERIAAKQADHGRAERHVLRMTYQPFPVHRSLVSLSPSTGIRSMPPIVRAGRGSAITHGNRGDRGSRVCKSGRALRDPGSRPVSTPNRR
jgi:hypothetical protein